MAHRPRCAPMPPCRRPSSERTTEMTTPWIDAKGIHTFYGSSHILHGIDFTVGQGETIGLMGRNGMGKSTLLKCPMCLVKPRSGSVGAAWGGGPRGQGDWTYERVLEPFPRLQERLRHGGQQLSGGEQQMLTIGRALMTNPDVLILDEATEGLAPLIAREIWRICSLIKDSGISSVIVDKNWKHVTQITDRNIILVKGQVVFEGSSDALHAQPQLLDQYLGV